MKAKKPNACSTTAVTSGSTGGELFSIPQRRVSPRTWVLLTACVDTRPPGAIEVHGESANPCHSDAHPEGSVRSDLGVVTLVSPEIVSGPSSVSNVVYKRQSCMEASRSPPCSPYSGRGAVHESSGQSEEEVRSVTTTRRENTCVSFMVDIALCASP